MLPFARTLCLAAALTGLLGQVPSAVGQTIKEGNRKAVVTVVKTITIKGVDPAAGDPEIRVMSTGAINLVFEVFPPSTVKSAVQAKSYESFDKRLGAFIGVPVSWEDRELFHVANPRPDTVERIKLFLTSLPGVTHK